MSLQLAVTTRNARLDAIQSEIGAAPVLKLRTGLPPSGCAAADSGTVLATLVLPTNWLAAASGGSKSMSGTWSELAADASGVAGHFRLYDSLGACHLQGTVSATGGGGDLILDSSTISAGQTVTVTSFTLVDGNA